ncbi:MAG: hypothetical protein M3239_08055 [Thermoproteota archaeon]|nr:hypothetical protein [Thermoproteota archaeon]
MVSATGKLGLTATATLVMAAAVIALLFLPLVASTTNSNTLLQFKQALAQVQEEAEQGTINNSTTITNDTTSTPQRRAFLPYENPAAGVFMQYPSNWTASISGLRDYTELIAFYSPLENLSQPLGTRLSVSLVKYAENVSLPEYTDFVLAGLQNQTQVEVKNSSDITVAGYPAHRLVLAGTTPLQNNLFTLYQMNTWITIGNKVYIVTYEGEESTFNRHLPEVTHMLESLAIT